MVPWAVSGREYGVYEGSPMKDPEEGNMELPSEYSS